MSSVIVKPSRFNVERKLDDEFKGFTVIFNTYTQALTIFEEEMWNRLKQGEYDGRMERFIDECRRQMFLVGPEIDETRLLMARKHELAYDTHMLSFKVVVTDHCNFACSYCVEEGFRGRRIMSAPLARQTSRFIIERIRKGRPDKVKLDFGGGEPLLNVAAMNVIAEGVSLFCRGAGIELDISFISNGSLLSDRLLNRLKQCGLRCIRVSLLPRSFQDTMRRDRWGRPTFEKILNNMAAIKEWALFHVCAQGDSEDSRFADAIPDWLARMEQKGLKSSIAEINIGMILKREYGVENAESFCGDLGQYEPYRKIQNIIRSHGFPIIDGPPGNDCMANNSGFHIIDPEGNLASCPTMLKHPELNVGDVRNGVDSVRSAMIMGRGLSDHCIEECELAPRCNGGCRYQALIRLGSFDEIYCNYDFTIAQMKDYITRRAVEFLTARKRKDAA